uniref:Single domain-containing protein n=1 Tax=Timema bartmani TaxID=61472 RepID=A0A7R9EYV9_9NEOP|nr:unnamed protein product [Timema bartmani]
MYAKLCSVRIYCSCHVNGFKNFNNNELIIDEENGEETQLKEHTFKTIGSQDLSCKELHRLLRNKMQKRISIVIVLIAVIVSVSKASLTSKIVKENKDHPGKCYDTSTKKAYMVDSTWTDEGCTRSSCSIGREKGTYEIFHAGCVPVEDQEGCKIISDSQKTFPECCPKVICDGK